MASKPKIMITEPSMVDPEVMAYLETFAAVTVVSVEEAEDKASKEAMLIKALKEGPYDAMFVRCATPCTAAVVAAGGEGGLKVIGTSTLGFDHIDQAALEAIGATMVTLRGTVAHTIPTAEHVFALALALLRHVPAAHAAAASGAWSKSRFLGHSLAGKRLAIVGLGSIGQYVARVASAFGMTITAYDPYAPPETFLSARAEKRETLEAVLVDADVLTLHCLLTPETRGMISAEALEQLPPHAVVINCGRGPLIDEHALVEALQNGTIAGAALDVFATEPLAGESAMAQYAASHDNAILTPHLGASTYEAVRDGGMAIAQRLEALLCGE